ncbi:MAG: hypothetical protein HFG75_13180 [Hungatella sp.]|nr:hypothetical protein [Hungatella sp.]
MSLCEMTFYSEILKMDTQISVILPEKEQGIGMGGYGTGKSDVCPVLWLLHGRSDDHTIWLRRTSIERYAVPLGLAVVMPEVSYSRYLNMAYGPAYYDYMTQELPRLCRQIFPSFSSRREENFIAGLSMGGGGAMYIGLRRPENYSHIGMFSTGGAVPLEPLWRTGDSGDKLGEDIYGTADTGSLKGGPYDLFVLARKAWESGMTLPSIYHTMGTEDPRYPAAIAVKHFFEGLPGNPFRYEYHEGPGSHEWAFWDQWIQGFLDRLNIREG